LIHTNASMDSAESPRGIVVGNNPASPALKRGSRGPGSAPSRFSRQNWRRGLLGHSGLIASPITGDPAAVASSSGAMRQTPVTLPPGCAQLSATPARRYKPAKGFPGHGTNEWRQIQPAADAKAPNSRCECSDAVSADGARPHRCVRQDRGRAREPRDCEVIRCPSRFPTPSLPP
jgi:hypothetical protein